MTGTFHSDEQRPEAIPASLSLQGNMEWPVVVKNVRQALHCCVRGLGILSSSTEEEFMMIAGTLENASSHVKKAPASAGISVPNVEDVVTLIQFHDITRQQFERSSSACRVMIERLAAEDGESAGAAGGKQSAAVSAEDLAGFCLHQARTIEETGGTFIAAVTRLIGKIGLIAGEIRKTAGDRAATEIEAAVHSICVHKFVHIVAEEVTSALRGLGEEIRPFLPAAAWEEIAASAGGAETHGDGAHAIRKDIPPEAENSLSDNVELF